MVFRSLEPALTAAFSSQVAAMKTEASPTHDFPAAKNIYTTGVNSADGSVQDVATRDDSGQMSRRALALAVTTPLSRYREEATYICKCQIW